MIELEMRKIRPKIVLLGLFFVLSLSISGWQIIVHQYLPVAPNDQSLIEVRLPENSSARQVAALLKQNGLIRNEKVFLVYLYQKGIERQLKAGLYVFSKSQSLPEMAGQISQGKVKSFTFTVPEGYTVRQIGELLINKQVCTQQQWAEALQASYNFDFLTSAKSGDEKHLEGFLFPDTYTIEEGTTAQDIINIMLGRSQLSGTRNTQRLRTLSNWVCGTPL